VRRERTLVVFGQTVAYLDREGVRAIRSPGAGRCEGLTTATTVTTHRCFDSLIRSGTAMRAAMESTLCPKVPQ